MKIVLFAHPTFLGQQSMPRFTNMLANGMQKRGHEVEIYSPSPLFFKLPAPRFFKKWLGYIDQFVVFPAIVRRHLKTRQNTLYVFTDHALGMWVPIVKHLPHVVICHDFLAQRSAKGQIPQNPTSRSGRVYQKLINKGYTQGKNFISVSKKTQEDLHIFLERTPALSKVIYNGLNKEFISLDVTASRDALNKKTGIDVLNGYILHVGGNQWYKNRTGVATIYNEWRRLFDNNLPLLLIGSQPSTNLLQEINKSAYKDQIYLLTDIGDEYINTAYSGASVLLFPSLAEGFGWPIAEAMASGCVVITTDEAPMTEVGADAAMYIPVQPTEADKTELWALEAAKTLNEALNMPDADKPNILTKGLNNAARFNPDDALDKFEKVFLDIAASR
ncbi:glycosyltransferase [Mucilaginibacter sp. X4EP1]|uniref:glycosyltransferase n=1 Tax=Mucilaginibacter sp. X4EP1 TaxID=2723092 RepID=UPI002167717A|nr:glycosyltransferase [Mucilaginibacter sp. X4EP1]MCS3815440.1 glycosyltransferase involved in cell wall biosynthesis [Mucilaginibacter sp. X4EP1]